MAKYDFRCEKCDIIFEVSIPMDERNNPQECPECKESTTKRYYGNSNFSGRVETDREAFGRKTMGKASVEKYKEVRAMRDKRKTDSRASDYAQKSNELWVQPKASGDSRINFGGLKGKRHP